MYVSESIRWEPYFGLSPEIEAVKQGINAIASAHCAALITGESGTGKGMVAHWIHSRSPRKNGAFVDINCSGLKGELLKSELFGHARGAFTGAFTERAGLIEEADGGTLFLDEIGDMDINVQCQLLKALEEKTFRRVGENQQRSSNFRLICATNCNLQKAMCSHVFREDLFYRINTLTISLPPLRTLRADIPGLINYMLVRMGYSFPINGDLAETLTQRPWRGNIRELRNTLERALILAHGETLTFEHFYETAESIVSEPDETPEDQTGSSPQDFWNLEALEEAHIRRALSRFGGDKSKTSEALGIALSSLYRKMDRMWKDGKNGGDKNTAKP